MSRALKEIDILELSKLFEAEFNQPDIHDRILVFDVVGSASWPRNQTKPNIEERERSEDETTTHSKDQQNKTGMSDNESDQTEGKEKSISDSSKKNREGNDCEIRAEQSQTDENEVSDETKTDDSQSATESSKTEAVPQQMKYKSAFNERVEITRNSSSEKDKTSLQDSKIVPGSGEANMNNKEQCEDNIGNYGGSSNASNEDEIIRQHMFYIHSSWLAVQSTYFRSMFFFGVKELNAREVHVQILVSEEKSHLMLLEAMYKIDTLDNASVDELLEILRLAHKYNVKFVFKKCKYCLQAAVVSFETCEQIMHFIEVDNDITDVEDLVSTLQSFLAKKFNPLDETWQTKSFEELREPFLRHLLSSNELVAASENTVFHALIHWIDQRGLENVSNDKGLPSLLSVVRFELMPIDYLYNIVQHNSVAKKLVDFNEHFLRGVIYHALTERMRRGLPSQPVNRKARNKPYIPYTWVIPKDKLDKLIGTEEQLKSDEFWFSGYKMALIIKCVKKLENMFGSLSTPVKFSATINLVMISHLSQQSFVSISWMPVGESLTSGGVTKIFKKDQHTSSLEINYKIGFDFSGSALGTSQSPGTVQSRGRQGLRPFRRGHTSSFGSAPTAMPAGGFGGLPLPLGSTINTLNKVDSSGANPPKPESLTTPCLSIDVQMTLLDSNFSPY